MLDTQSPSFCATWKPSWQIISTSRRMARSGVPWRRADIVTTEGRQWLCVFGMMDSYPLHGPSSHCHSISALTGYDGRAEEAKLERVPAACAAIWRGVSLLQTASGCHHSRVQCLSGFSGASDGQHGQVCLPGGNYGVCVFSHLFPSVRFYDGMCALHPPCVWAAGIMITLAKQRNGQWPQNRVFLTSYSRPMFLAGLPAISLP